MPIASMKDIILHLPCMHMLNKLKVTLGIIEGHPYPSNFQDQEQVTNKVLSWLSASTNYQTYGTCIQVPYMS